MPCLLIDDGYLRKIVALQHSVSAYASHDNMANGQRLNFLLQICYLSFLFHNTSTAVLVTVSFALFHKSTTLSHCIEAFVCALPLMYALRQHTPYYDLRDFVYPTNPVGHGNPSHDTISIAPKWKGDE